MTTRDNDEQLCENSYFHFHLKIFFISIFHSKFRNEILAEAILRILFVAISTFFKYFSKLIYDLELVYKYGEKLTVH